MLWHDFSKHWNLKERIFGPIISDAMLLCVSHQHHQCQKCVYFVSIRISPLVHYWRGRKLLGVDKLGVVHVTLSYNQVHQGGIKKFQKYIQLSALAINSTICFYTRVWSIKIKYLRIKWSPRNPFTLYVDFTGVRLGLVVPTRFTRVGIFLVACGKIRIEEFVTRIIFRVAFLCRLSSLLVRITFPILRCRWPISTYLLGKKIAFQSMIYTKLFINYNLL